MTLPRPEAQAIAQTGGRKAARAAARLMATSARQVLSRAEEVLVACGDETAAAVARDAGEATTRLISATFDGEAQVFACRR